MKQIILLTKILFKSSTNEIKQINKKKTIGTGKIIFFILIYAYIMGVIGFISYSIIKSLMTINQEAIFLNLALVMMLGISVIQTIITSLNILYFSKDLEFLLPLPITAIQIVMAKINCLIISQYIMMTLILLPAIIVYGLLLKLGISFYLIGISVILLFPIIPVVLTSFLVTIVMKFTKIVKNKEVIQYLTVILTIILVIVLQPFTGINENISSEELANKLVETNGLVEVFSKGFPTIKLSISAILNYNNSVGFVNILTLFILSITIYLIISKLIANMYVKTVISLTTIKNNKTKKIDKTKAFHINNTLVSYIKKEFNLLNRNPIFFMQCVVPSILFPVIISIPLFMTLKDSGTDVNALKANLELINTPFGLIGCLVTIIFFFMLNFASVTCVSRDGENATFMKYIPISLDRQILYKIIPGVLLNFIPIIYLVLLCKIFISAITLKTIFYISIISVLINIFNNYMMIIVDLKNPKLKWITEYAVVKQNFNMIYEIILSCFEIVVIILTGIIISNINILAIILILMFVVLNLIVKKYIVKNKQKLFGKIV